MQTEEQKYRQADGLNYSLLADFSDSPDRALMPREPKGYFEMGDIFETVFQDEIQGTNLFAETYFVAELRGSIPDKICKWLDDPECEIDPFVFLSSNFKYNKDGVTRSGTQKNVHAWLDACIEFPGKRPVSQTMMAEIKAMVANMLKMEIMGAPLVDILQNAQFQIPLFWEQDGIKKKSLADIIAQVTINGQPTMICFDLKTAVDLPKFRRMFQSRYYLQDLHYVSIAKDNYENVYPNMIFLVASKSEPFIAQAFEMESKSREYCQDKYDQLCDDFVVWDRAGRPPVGWKPLETVKIYI